MAAAKFKKRIEVVYTLIGDSTPRRARLLDLDEKIRADVDKLTILPVYNNNKKLSTDRSLSKIENFLTGFSALTVIAYPGQFQNINSSILISDTRCPNLRVVCHYGHDDISSQGFKGTLNGVEVTSPDGELGSFAYVIGDTVKDGETSRPILREYKFIPKRTLSRASVAKRTPIQPIVTSESVASHTQTILVAINELNVTIPDENQRFVADEELVKNLLTIIRELGVEEELLNNNVEHLISQINGLRGADTSTVADNCGEYFEEFFNKVIEEAKKSQKQKLIASAVESVKNVTPGNFKDIAVTYLALEEVFTEDALNEKGNQLTERKKKSLIEKEEQRLLEDLKAEIGEERFANLSEEDKTINIREYLDKFINEKLPSKINDKQIKDEAIVELNQEAMGTLKWLRTAMDKELIDSEKERADRWIASLSDENLYSLVTELNSKKVSQEKFEEVLKPLIANDKVRGLFISAIMAKCNGVVTEEMLEEIKYIIAGIPQNASEEEIVNTIDASMITLGDIEKILNESSEFRQFRDSIDTLTLEEDKEYARGVITALSQEMFENIKGDLQNGDLTKAQVVQTYAMFVKTDTFAGIVQRAAEDCKISVETSVDEEVLPIDEQEEIIDEENENPLENDEKPQPRKYISYSKLKAICGEVEEYRILRDTFRDAYGGVSGYWDTKTILDIKNDVDWCFAEVYKARATELREANSVEEEIRIVRDYVHSDEFKNHIAGIMAKLQARESYAHVDENAGSPKVGEDKPRHDEKLNILRVQELLNESEEYRALFNAYRAMPPSKAKKAIMQDIAFCDIEVLYGCIDALNKASTIEEEAQIIRDYIASDSFKHYIADIAKKYGLTLQPKEERILVTIDDISDLLVEYDSYTDLLKLIDLQTNEEKKNQAQEQFDKIPTWVFEQCKDKLLTCETLDDQMSIIKEFIGKNESFKTHLDGILSSLDVNKDEIREMIVVERLKTTEYVAIIDFIKNMPTGKLKKDIVLGSCEISTWVLSECKKKLGMTSEDPTQEQIAKFLTEEEFKNYINQFAKDHGIELVVEEPKHEEELPAWHEEFKVNMKFVATLARLREDLKDDNEKYIRLVEELTVYVIQTVASEISKVSEVDIQIEIVRNFINNSEEFNKKIKEIYKRENIITEEAEEEIEEDEPKDRIAQAIELVCQNDENYNFFMGEIEKISDEARRAVVIAKVNYYVDKMVRKVEGISNESTDKEIDEAIKLVLSSEGFNRKCRELTSEDTTEEFNVLETITTNSNYLDFMRIVNTRLADDELKVKIGSHIVHFIVEHCESQVDDERDVANKVEIVNEFINGARFRGEVSKIYKQYEIETADRSSDEETSRVNNLFDGFSNDAFGRVLNSTDEYKNFVNAIYALEIDESNKLAIITEAVNFIKEKCKEEVNNASTEIKKIGCIKTFLRSSTFAENARKLIEDNTPAPRVVAKPTEREVEVVEPDTDRARIVTRGTDINPSYAIDEEAINEALRKFVATYEERQRTLDVTGGGENEHAVIPLLASAENLKIGTFNLIYNTGEMGDVITPAQIDSDGAEFNLANRVDGARNIASGSSAIADASGETPAPSVADMFGITPASGDTVGTTPTGDNSTPNPAFSDDSRRGVTVPASDTPITPTTSGVEPTASAAATTPVATSTGTPIATTPSSTADDGKKTTATTPTGATATASTPKGASATASTAAPTSTESTATKPTGDDKKTTPAPAGDKGGIPAKGTNTSDGKPTPSDDGKKGAIAGDGKKVAPEKKDIPKVRLLEYGEKTLDVINEPKKPWYKRLAKWVVRHPIATTAICLGAGALVAAGIGVIAAGGVVPALNALNFALPKVATISGAVGLGAGGLIAGGLLIGTNVSKTGKKERLYKKFEKKYKKCQSIQENIAEYQETINANKEKQRLLEERHRSSKGILKSLGVYKRARKKVRKQNRKLTQKIREAEETYAETVSEAINKKNELNTVEATTGKSLALGGYFDRKKKVEEEFRAGKIDKEDYDFEMEDLEEEVPGITKTSSRVKTFDGEVSELIANVKKEHATKRMSETIGEIRRRYTRLEPEVHEAPDLGSEIVEEITKRKAKEEIESAGGTFVESDFSTSYEAMKKKQKGKVDAYKEFGKHNPEAFKKANEEFDKNSAEGKDKDEPSK